MYVRKRHKRHQGVSIRCSSLDVREKGEEGYVDLWLSQEVRLDEDSRSAVKSTCHPDILESLVKESEEADEPAHYIYNFVSEYEQRGQLHPRS